ncbi:hypothetical protein HY625_03165 [Candidatus Uhrbacteria bacterium]|nr:hypothetical protein [Candidatus Uhrbacteria bacterium]
MEGARVKTEHEERIVRGSVLGRKAIFVYGPPNLLPRFKGLPWVFGEELLVRQLYRLLIGSCLFFETKFGSQRDITNECYRITLINLANQKESKEGWTLTDPLKVLCGFPDEHPIFIDGHHLSRNPREGLERYTLRVELIWTL